MVYFAVLRLGHRPERDQRVTTHVGLTARALGAAGMYLASADKYIVEGIQDVVDRWGGDFFIKDQIKWRTCINRWKESGGIVLHLTMYGIPLQDIEELIKKSDRILIVVGAEKVPGELFGLADYNVAVTNQPHSEVAGLAVVMDHLNPTALVREFPDAKLKVIPQEHGKRTDTG